jgi:hypothetical protein
MHDLHDALISLRIYCREEGEYTPYGGFSEKFIGLGSDCQGNGVETYL